MLISGFHIITLMLIMLVHTKNSYVLKARQSCYGLLFCSYRSSRSQSCPFCRDSLKRVNSGELWIYTSKCDIVDLSVIKRENLKRLLIYIDKLPLIVPDAMLVSYDPRYR